MSTQGFSIINELVIPLVIGTLGLITILIFLLSYKNKKNG